MIRTPIIVISIPSDIKDTNTQIKTKIGYLVLSPLFTILFNSFEYTSFSTFEINSFGLDLSAGWLYFDELFCYYLTLINNIEDRVDSLF